MTWRHVTKFKLYLLIITYLLLSFTLQTLLSSSGTTYNCGFMGGLSTIMLCGRKPIPTNLVGLDGSGKTTILYKYKLGLKERVDTIPTIGYNLEVITYKSYSFEVMDYGGGDKIQPIWSRLFRDKSVFIFMVDSADRERVQEARDRLDLWLYDNDTENILVLVFANKQDLPNVMTVTEIIDKLRLKTLRYRWHVQPCIAITGEGTSEGLDWLYKNIP